MCCASTGNDYTLGPFPIPVVLDPGGGSNRYRLDTPLGRGRYGEVFEAVRVEDHTAWAVKVLPRTRGPREAAAQSLYPYTQDNLHRPHPNLVHLEDAFTIGERFYIAMELCDGSLDHFIANGDYDPHTWLLPIARQVLGGLAKIHAAGAVHCDLHGRNVLYAANPDGTPTFKVSDLGQRVRWYPVEGEPQPEKIQHDIRAAAALLTEVALGDVLYSGAEGHLHRLPELVADALRDGFHDGYDGEGGATDLLTAVEETCLIEGW